MRCGLDRPAANTFRLRRILRSRLAATALFLMDFLGINYLFSLKNRKSALILWYHGVCDDDFRLLRGYDERHIPLSLFQKQLSHLEQRGYQFATMSQLMQRLAEKRHIGRLAVLTFDDGFRNVLRNAYPAMKARGAKGCLYVVSSLVGSRELLWTDRVETAVREHKSDLFTFHFNGEEIRYELSDSDARAHAMKDMKSRLRSIPDGERNKQMSQFRQPDHAPAEFMLCDWEELRCLDRNFLEIGSHTRTHPNCENLESDESLDDEIVKSKADIEQQMGYPVPHFNYPAGSYDDRVITWVNRAGYGSAVTTNPGLIDAGAKRFELKRIGVNENFLLFKSMVSGSFFFLRNLMRFFGAST